MGGDGPTIQVCTSLASMIGWTIGIRAARTQSLLASLGFCCGFAASFNAPLSGMLFAMEELQHISGRLTTRVICIILVGSITSTAVMRGFLSNKVLFKATYPSDLESMVAGGSVDRIFGPQMWMLISILIGLLSALVGFAFSKVFHFTHKFLNTVVLPRIPRWIVFGVLGGLVAAIGSLVYRTTGLTGVWGVGVNSLQQNLDQDYPGHAGHLVIFALGKLAAFALSVSARFPGDTLEPVLIAGSFLGAAVGKHLPVEVVGDSYAPCVIFGMVGLFASCFRFPLTPVVIVLELTGTRSYNLILPVTLSSFTGLAVSNHLFPPVLEQMLHQDNIDLEAVAELAELAEEEEDNMRQQMPVAQLASSNGSEASGISFTSEGRSALRMLATKLEDSMVDVSTTRRSRLSLYSGASSGAATSRRGSVLGRGLRRLSMRSGFSGGSPALSEAMRDRRNSSIERSRSPVSQRRSLRSQDRLERQTSEASALGRRERQCSRKEGRDEDEIRNEEFQDVPTEHPDGKQLDEGEPIEI